MKHSIAVLLSKLMEAVEVKRGGRLVEAGGQLQEPGPK
jgi:hypothetical protein